MGHKCLIAEFWMDGWKEVTKHCTWHEIDNVEELIESVKELLNHDGSNLDETFKVMWRDDDGRELHLEWNKANPEEPVITLHESGFSIESEG